MKKKIKLISLGVIFCSSISNGATIQLTTAPGLATILNDSSGSPIGNAPWGLVVDTGPMGGDGFGDFSSELLGFTVASGFIGNTNDYFYLSANPTLAAGILGAATQVIANYDDEAAVVGSQNYKIIWFEGKSAGEVVDATTTYGLTSTTAVLPASNAAAPFPSDFHGANGNSSIAVVPEPSSLLLSLLGFTALLRRKR